ncbi:MAG: hypothetical protein SOS24_04520 [Clostridia bacterium]|nr:hypothetical protein [Clostridia bacterium]
MKKAIAILLSSCMIACAVPNVALGASVTMTVNTGTVVNKVPEKLFGVNTDWSMKHPAVSVNSSKASANPNFLKAFDEYKLPLVRIGEGATPSFDWEKAIGDYASRQNQTLWGITGKVAAGPIELVNTFEQIDKNVAFTFTVDVMNSDYAAKAGRYAQFLTGGADTEYGQKRIEQGHPEPINVVLYELGNETDWADKNNLLTAAEYIKRCKETISAIKAVDPNAKFATHIDTTIYQSVNNPTKNPYDTKAAWHRAILADSALMQNVSYLSIHSYYGYYDNLMETLISNIENDIKSSSFPNTKIFISEHALARFDTTGDGVNNTNPSAMEGTIETAFTLQRLMAHSSVDMATFHAIFSNVWNNIWKDSTTGEIQLNSIGQLLILFKEYGVGELLSSSYSGFDINSDSSANGVAVRDSNGNINLIFTNNTSSEQAVTISLSGTERYVISDEMEIAANSGRSDVISADSNGISIKKYEYNKDTIFSGSYSVPAYSVCAVRLSPKASSEFTQKTLISENFNSTPNYTLPEGWEIMNGRSLAYAENGALIVKADEYHKPVYIKIGGASQMKKAGLTVEADITLIEQNETARTQGARNKAGFAFVNGEQYSNGGLLTFYPQCEFSESGDTNLTQGNVTYNSGEEFSSKAPVHLKLVFTNSTIGPDIYVNGVKQNYTNKTSTNTENGSVCLMVQAATVKFDNVTVTGEKCHKLSAPPTVTKSFEYTQNFDNMADGSLPEGWTLYRNSSKYGKTIAAQVKKGALDLSENNPTGRGGYLIFDIPGLANADAKNLTMECDITLANSLGVEIKEPTVDDCVGFAYDFDESKIDAAKIADVNGVKVVDGGVPWETAFRVRMYTNKGTDTTKQMLLSEKYNTKSEYRSKAITSNENKINTAGTENKMKLKMDVIDTGYYPKIYLNGTEAIENSHGTGSEYVTPLRTSGKIGLYIKNTAVTIDNIKITGTGDFPDIATYQSSFKTAGARYASVKAAKDDIVVKSYDYLGNEIGDVTSSATITGTDNGDGTGTINVLYGDYGERLLFSFTDRVTRSFVYEENFDTMADGSLPEGWTLYRNSSNYGKTIAAQVKNGALEITDNNYYSRGYLIFDIPELASVNSQNLTMECDITLGNSLGITGDNKASDAVGFAYAFDESKIAAANIKVENGVKVVDGGVPWETAYRVRMYTNKGADITNQQLLSEKCNQDSTYKSIEITSNENKINTAGTSQTMKLKIDVTDTNYYPEIYLNGTKIENTKGTYITPDRTSGKIGLFINDTSVTIDNIRITGTRTGFATDADSLAISNVKYDSSTSKLGVMADASLAAAAGSENSVIVAAVYDNSDKLVSIKAVDVSNAADYHGTITLNGISSELASGKVKLFFWDMTRLKPFIPAVVNNAH